MAGKTGRSGRKLTETTPLDLTEQLNIRLSPVLMEGIDRFCRIIEAEEHVTITRSDACRRLLARAIHNLPSDPSA